ncbi:MAG: hypothetical protein GY811_14270 [Myxococcales bacterium]|nr:hypothetical protein [Myxococcales bacterium]
MANDVGSLLLRAGLVDPDQLDRARSAVEAQGGTVPEELVRRGDVGDEDLTSFYRSRLLIPRVNPSELTRLNSGLLEKIPADMAAEFRSIPVSLDSDGNLTLIMSDPSDTRAAEEISFFTGSYVMRAVATQAQIAWCLAHYYKQETDLYRALVAEGAWPDAETSDEEDTVPTAKDLPGETAPMRTLPRPVSSKAPREPSAPKTAADEEEKTTGPLKTKAPARPANQRPSPPELFARAGEIESVPKPVRQMDSAPAVHICLDQEEKAVVKSVQRGTDTAPILLSILNAKHSALPERSGPIILDASDRKRRVSRQTNLGLGIVPGDSGPSPIQKALAERAEAGPQNISVPISEAEESPDTSTGTGLAEGKPSAAIAEVRATEEVADSSASETPSAAKANEEMPPARALARSMNLVGGDWGEPGTTIPPAYIGAHPQAYEDAGDSIPIPIDDAGEVASQIDTRAPSIPVLVSSEGDATVRSGEPTAVRQGNLADSASRLLVALRTIDAAEDKRGVLEPMLNFLDTAFERSGFLALRQEDLTTWLLHGCMDDAKSTIRIDADSTFKDVLRMRLPYNGPIEDPTTKQFARDLDMPDAFDLLAVPIAIRDRVVGILFGLGSCDALYEEHLSVLSQAAGESLERILRARK